MRLTQFLMVRGSVVRHRSLLFALTAAGLMFSSACSSIPQAAPVTQQHKTDTSRAADSCIRCITLQITPLNASIAPGASMQFSAAVTNTSNSAVTWSASAGTITSTGRFTAPLKSTGTAITITASSLASPNTRASASLAVTALEPLQIVSTEIPSGSASTPYEAQLNATGGSAPYRWQIVSGALPAGLELDPSSGSITGVTTQSGAFAFTLAVSDTAALSARQNFSLRVSEPVATCGPPAYRCSRSDHRIAQLPHPAPDVGNLSGANSVVTDPAFGNRIVRVTDANTDPASRWGSARTFVSSTSGSADENLWNVDSTLLILQDNNGAAYPFSFNPSTLHATRLYRSTYPATSGLKLSDGGTWSRLHPSIFYLYDGTAVMKYDFSDRERPPIPEKLFDFASSRNCLPAGFSAAWRARAGVSAGDTTFGVAFSTEAKQGTAVYAMVYRAGHGCSLLNTRTGQVSGDWGGRGAINIPDHWTIHNVKLSKDGDWLIIAPQKCTSSQCDKGPYFWKVGTTHVATCGNTGQCGGHWTEGHSHWVNNDNSPLGNQVIRAFSDADSAPGVLTSNLPEGITQPFDQHQSWNNADPADSLPILTSTWSSTSPFPAPWYNEIVGVASDGSGRVWRFAHSYITTRSQVFSAQYGIGAVSQDGRFFLFSSDWMGSLGSESGAHSCTIGKNCRADVFVVELR